MSDVTSERVVPPPGGDPAQDRRIAMVHRVRLPHIGAAQRNRLLDELHGFVARDVIAAELPVDTIVLDFSDVAFVDPAGITAVIRFRAGLTGLGLRLRIVGTCSAVRGAITVLGLDDRLGLEPGDEPTPPAAPTDDDDPLPTA